MLKDFLKVQKDREKALERLRQRLGVTFQRERYALLSEAFRLDAENKPPVVVGVLRGRCIESRYYLYGWTLMGVSLEPNQNPFWGDYQIEEVLFDKEEDALAAKGAFYDLLMIRASGGVK